VLALRDTATSDWSVDSTRSDDFHVFVRGATVYAPLPHHPRAVPPCPSRPNRPQQLVPHYPTFPVQPRLPGLVRLDSRRSPHACRGAPVIGPLPCPAFHGILYFHKGSLIPECANHLSPSAGSFPLSYILAIRLSIYEVRRLPRCSPQRSSFHCSLLFSPLLFDIHFWCSYARSHFSLLVLTPSPSHLGSYWHTILRTE